MNIGFFMGNLATEPKLRETPEGKKFLRNTLLVWRPKKSSGQTFDAVPFIAWDKNAEFLAQYTKKNTKIVIEGAIQNNSYRAPDGTEKKVFEIVVKKCEFGLKDLPTT